MWNRSWPPELSCVNTDVLSGMIMWAPLWAPPSRQQEEPTVTTQQGIDRPLRLGSEWPIFTFPHDGEDLPRAVLSSVEDWFDHQAPIWVRALAGDNFMEEVVAWDMQQGRPVDLPDPTTFGPRIALVAFLTEPAHWDEINRMAELLEEYRSLVTQDMRELDADLAATVREG